MWQQISEILPPSSSMTAKQAKWNWSEEYQKAFDTIKKLFLEKLCSHIQTSMNQPFEIHKDTNKLQLESVISQKVKPIAFYNRKLNPAQVNYTTTQSVSYFLLWKP